MKLHNAKRLSSQKRKVGETICHFVTVEIECDGDEDVCAELRELANLAAEGKTVRGAKAAAKEARKATEAKPKRRAKVKAE